MPIRATVPSDATKPPTLTIPVALPRRVGGLKVRARSNPTIEPGPPTASTTTRTTSSHRGARPGQRSTTAQVAMIEPTIHRTRVDREYGQRVTNAPIRGLVTTAVTVISMSRLLAALAVRPCPETRNGNPHKRAKTVAPNCTV